MGEIRSTLDIIMEKTRGMSLSDDEKQKLLRKELQDALRGFVQKYLDAVIDLDRLSVEFTALSKKHPAAFKQAVCDEVIPRMIAGETNESLLDVMGLLPDIDIGRIKEVIDDEHEAIMREKSARYTGLKERLKRKGISGSAVIPNLAADSGWADFLADRKEVMEEKLSSDCR